MRHLTLQPAILLAAAAGMLGVLPGCRGDREDAPPRQFFPDMDDSPKWHAQAETEFFPDGRTMRPTVPGTVPFARWGYGTGEFVGQLPEGFSPIYERSGVLKLDDAVYRGIESTNAEGAHTLVRRVPIEVDAALLKRGQERFNIYCAACHGYTGRGEGMVGQRWTATVANLHDPAFSDPNEPNQRGTDGHIFRTAMWGLWDAATGAQRMPAYAHALSEHDAWGVVAYVRALQRSQRGTLEEVPAEVRPALEQQRAQMPAPAPQPGNEKVNP